MPIAVYIEGQNGESRRLKVGKEGELEVVVHGHPPIKEIIDSYPFSQFFKNSSNSSDMRVNGSSTSVDFYIQSSTERDYFIKTVSVIIADASSVLNKFGNLTALTNGIDFIYKNSAVGEVTIRSDIKTNLDFIRLGTSTGSVGSGTDAWLSDLSGAGADAYLPVLDMSVTFGYPYGLHLRKGKMDQLIFRVNDDLSTGLDQFDIIGYGIQI